MEKLTKLPWTVIEDMTRHYNADPDYRHRQEQGQILISEMEKIEETEFEKGNVITGVFVEHNDTFVMFFYRMGERTSFVLSGTATHEWVELNSHG